MTDYDKRVNDEADEHAQMMNKQREGWELKNQPKVYVASLRTAAWTWPTSHSEQFNED